MNMYYTPPPASHETRTTKHPSGFIQPPGSASPLPPLNPKKDPMGEGGERCPAAILVWVVFLLVV